MAKATRLTDSYNPRRNVLDRGVDSVTNLWVEDRNRIDVRLDDGNYPIMVGVRGYLSTQEVTGSPNRDLVNGSLLVDDGFQLCL